MDIVRKILEKKNFTVEHFEYKVTYQSEIRRPINPMVKDSPTEKVKVEKRININTRLKALKQLVGRVLKDPENVLLLQINRIKGESLCLPLIFEAVFKSNRQIFIADTTKQIQTQLLAEPDLTFQKIPPIVQNHKSCLTGLLERSKRTKGMQSAMRGLQDFTTFPKTISEKIKLIVTGRKPKLSDAEAVNLLLLSDLQSRYAPVFTNFQQDIIHRTGTVEVLSMQFAILTQGINTESLITQLEEYLGESVSRCRKNSHLFILLYRNLEKLDDPKTVKNGTVLTRASLFNLLKSIIFTARSQYDPAYWQRCLFFFDMNDEETKAEDNQAAINALTDTSKTYLKKRQASSNKDLFESYFIHNFHQHVLDREIWISDQHLTKIEKGVIESVVMPNLHFRSAKGTNTNRDNGLFVHNGLPAGVLVNPVHFAAKAYGRIIHRRLCDNTKKLLKPGVAELRERYGTLFFDILYDRAVFEPGFHVSRNHYFTLLQSHFLSKRSQEIGYVELETDFGSDPLLTSGIICGSSESMFAANFSNDDFHREYGKSRNQFSGFIENLAKLKEADQGECDPVPIFLDMMQEGHYNFRSFHFRKRVQETFLYEELTNIINESCAEIISDLKTAAVNDKVVLQIPTKLDSVLFIGNTFLIAAGYRNLRIRLLASTAADQEESLEVSQTFSRNFESHLISEATAGRKGLLRAIRIFQEYHKTSWNFLRYMSILVLDRHIQNIQCIEKEKDRFSPEHIKFYLPDSRKLLVGNIREANLNPIYQHFSSGKSTGKSEVEAISFEKFLQAIVFYKAATQDLEAKREVSSKVMDLLDKFTERLKKSRRWKSYYHITQNFHAILLNPVEDFDERLLNLLSALGNAMKKIVDREEYKDGVIGLLYAEWKRRNPQREKEIYYFLPFLNVNAVVGEDIVLKIRFARDLMRKLKQKHCLVLLAKESKGDGVRQIIEIDAFIKEKLGEIKVFIETGSLSGDMIDALCKKFPPKNLLVLNRLSPVAYDRNEALQLDLSTAGNDSPTR